MKIKTLIQTLALGVGLTASSLFANTVVVTQTGYNGVPNARGGEFLVVSSNHGTFLSFCLEKEVDIHMNVEYSYTIDQLVQLGNDPITQGTAWLYTSFVNGSLTDSTGAGNYWDEATRKVNAGVLQLAIWALEGQIDWDANNEYLKQASLQFADAQADYSGSHVQVMNLWGENREDIQSQLYLVPDGATTSVLLGLGLISLVFVRRKL